MTTFAEWTEAFCAGYSACNDGLSDDDGEAFLQAIGDSWKQSGGQRAKRIREAVENGEDYAEAYARENPDGFRI